MSGFITNILAKNLLCQTALKVSPKHVNNETGKAMFPPPEKELFCLLMFLDADISWILSNGF